MLAHKILFFIFIVPKNKSTVPQMSFVTRLKTILLNFFRPRGRRVNVPIAIDVYAAQLK